MADENLKEQTETTDKTGYMYIVRDNKDYCIDTKNLGLVQSGTDVDTLIYDEITGDYIPQGMRINKQGISVEIPSNGMLPLTSGNNGFSFTNAGIVKGISIIKDEAFGASELRSAVTGNIEGRITGISKFTFFTLPGTTFVNDSPDIPDDVFPNGVQEFRKIRNNLGETVTFGNAMAVEMVYNNEGTFHLLTAVTTAAVPLTEVLIEFRNTVSLTTAITLTFSGSGNHRIIWGDGTSPVTFVSGDELNHTFSDGDYKAVIITDDPVSITGIEASSSQIFQFKNLIALTSLTTINFGYNNLYSFNFADIPTVTDIRLPHNPTLTALENGNSISVNVTYIDIGHCAIVGAFVIENKNNLIDLHFDDNSITSVTIKNCANLGYIFGNFNPITNSTFNNLPSLVTLYLQNSSLAEFDFAGIPTATFIALKNAVTLTTLYNVNSISANITVIDLSNTRVTGDFILTNRLSLGNILLTGHNLSKLDFSGCTSFNPTSVGTFTMTLPNVLTSAKFTGCLVMTKFIIANQAIDDLDITGCVSLNLLDVDNNDNGTGVDFITGLATVQTLNNIDLTSCNADDGTIDTWINDLYTAVVAYNILDGNFDTSGVNGTRTAASDTAYNDLTNPATYNWTIAG